MVNNRCVHCLVFVLPYGIEACTYGAARLVCQGRRGAVPRADCRPRPSPCRSQRSSASTASTQRSCSPRPRALQLVSQRRLHARLFAVRGTIASATPAAGWNSPIFTARDRGRASPGLGDARTALPRRCRRKHRRERFGCGTSSVRARSRSCRRLGAARTPARRQRQVRALRLVIYSPPRLVVPVCHRGGRSSEILR